VAGEVNPGFAITVTAPYSAPGCNGLYGEVEPVRATFSRFRYNRIISQVENDIGKDGKSFIKVFQRALIKILEQTQLLAVSVSLFTALMTRRLPFLRFMYKTIQLQLLQSS